MTTSKGDPTREAFAITLGTFLSAMKSRLLRSSTGDGPSAIGNHVLAARACLATVKGADAERAAWGHPGVWGDGGTWGWDAAERELERELAKRLEAFMPTLSEQTRTRTIETDAQDLEPGTRMFDEYVILSDYPDDFDPTSWDAELAAYLDDIGSTSLLQKDGIFAWDAELAAYLDDIGSTGKEIAAKIRRKAAERWAEKKETFTQSIHALARLWVSHDDVQGDGFQGPLYGIRWDYLAEPKTPVFPIFHASPMATPVGVFLALEYIARALWFDVVQPHLEQARKKPASLVRAVHVSATDFHSRGPRFDEKTHSLTFQGQELAKRIGATFDLDVIQRGLGLLGSVVSHELFHWEVTTGHEQHLRGIANPHVLEIEGGWVALAERLGLRPEKHRVNLRALVLAQAAFHFPFPDGSRGNMLVFSERPALGRQRAHVRIELGTVLMPGYVHAHGLPQRERKLVPLLRERVPLYGRPNEHGEQRSMSLAVVATLRDRARELVQEGGVRLTTDTAADLADRSGLPRRLIVPVIEHWVNGDTRAPPFLKRTGRERYTLSDVHAAEREFIEDGGRAELQGAELGQRSVKKKRAKLARIERKPREK